MPAEDDGAAAATPLRGVVGTRAKSITLLASAALGILLFIAYLLVGRAPAPQSAFALARCQHRPRDIAVWLTNDSKLLITFPWAPTVHFLSADGNVASVRVVDYPMNSQSQDTQQVKAGRVGQLILAAVPGERFRVEIPYCYDANPVAQGVSLLVRKLPAGWRGAGLTADGFSWQYRCGLADGKCWRVFRSHWLNRQDLPVWSDPPGKGPFQ